MNTHLKYFRLLLCKKRDSSRLNVVVYFQLENGPILFFERRNVYVLHFEIGIFDEKDWTISKRCNKQCHLNLYAMVDLGAGKDSVVADVHY